jgi:hypothetical protein
MWAEAIVVYFMAILRHLSGDKNSTQNNRISGLRGEDSNSDPPNTNQESKSPDSDFRLIAYERSNNNLRGKKVEIFNNKCTGETKSLFATTRT